MGILRSLYHRERHGCRTHGSGTGDLQSIVEDFNCHLDDCHTMHSAMGDAVVPTVSCSFCKVSGYEQILAVADEDGSVRILDTNESGLRCCQEHWVAHGNAIFDIAWLESEPQLLTASGDQTAVLWNLNPVVKLATFEGHSCSLKAVSCKTDNKFVFSTCGRDGNIMIWDTRCNKRGNHYTPVDTIHSAHINPSVATPKQRKKGLCNTKPSNDSQHSVTAVVFQDEYTLISAGAMDGAIKMWDLRKNYNRVKEPVPKHVFPYAGCSTRKRGFSSLILDSTSSRVFASCTDDIIYQYNCAGISTTPVARYTGHLNNSSFYVKAALSPDDQYLLSGSSDDNAYIWHVGKSEKPLFQLKGHSSEVTSVAWNHQDFTKLVTSSDDNTVKIWRLNRRENSLQGVEKSGWCEKMNTITPSVVDNGAEREPKMSNCVQAVPVINSSTPMQQMVSGPSSPLQGAIVSASQVSSIPKKRATLPLTPPQNDISRKYISPKLKNSSIKKWFNKNTPKRQSPRKSPRKSPVKEKENVCKEVSARGVKRKIENDERFSEDSKRKMTCESTSIDDLKPLDSLEENGVILADHTYMKVTPVKEKRSTIGESEHFTCRSPTVNLPNLILDSPKRDSELLIQANSEKEHKEDKPKVNWLTQIVRQKRLQSGDDDVIQKPGRGTHSDNTGKCPSPKLQKDSITSVGKESSFGRSRPLSPIGRSRPLSPIGRSRPLSPRFTQAPISPKSPKSPNIRHYFQPLLSSTGAK